MSGGPQARLFAALELPGELALRLVAWARLLAGDPGRGRAVGALRALDPSSLHLTLCFLGNRPAEDIDELAEALVGACEGASTLELSLGAPVWLPPRRPRALAIEIHEATGGLGTLQGAVESALTGEGGRRRRFRPHVTVARTRPGFDPGAGAMPATPSVSFEVQRVELIRSWLEPRGARYEVQGSVTLGPHGSAQRS